jgi:hypothetical protein
MNGRLDLEFATAVLARNEQVLDEVLAARHDLPADVQALVAASGLLERLRPESCRELALVSAITDELFAALLGTCSSDEDLEAARALASRQDITTKHLMDLAEAVPEPGSLQQGLAVSALASLVVSHHAADLEVKLSAAQRAPKAVFYRLSSEAGPAPELDLAMARAAQDGLLHDRVVENCVARTGFRPTRAMPHGFLVKWFPGWLERELAEISPDAEGYGAIKEGWEGSLEDLLATVGEFR